MERKFTTHPRVLNDLFAQYANTFVAFCELVNNSLQAQARNIYITIDQINKDEIELGIAPIRKIIIKDDGHGIAGSEFDNKIFHIGTDAKYGGKGIGRFAALQIGATAEMETVGYDRKEKKFTKTNVSFHEHEIRSKRNISDVNLKSHDVLLEGKQDTYFQVIIRDLYNTERIQRERKKRIDPNLYIENISNALFERYSIKIVNREVNIFINEQKIDPSDYVIGQPENRTMEFVDSIGNRYAVDFNYMHIRSSHEEIKVFLTVDNAGLKTTSVAYDYNILWLGPHTGAWFVYVNSDFFTTDMLRNIDLGELDDNNKRIRTLIKGNLNEFFKEKNQVFEEFTKQLKSDTYYPYSDDRASSSSKVMVFNKVAFLIEEKHHLLKDNNQLRGLIYSLMDRTISDGNFKDILSSFLKLDDKFVLKFNDILKKAELEDIIEFSEKVAHKLQQLDFLEKIIYTEIGKHLKERSQLHKILEKMLWIFGESYNDSTKMLSDKNLENNLQVLRDDLLEFKEAKDKTNVNPLPKGSKLRTITDLFLYSEKIISDEKKEVLVVELKAPCVKISAKELQQVQTYAFQIGQRGEFPRNLIYKILLIGSDFTEQTIDSLEGTSKGKDNPYFYWANSSNNIQIWVIRWSDILENNKRRLKYMANGLKVRDINVTEKFEKDFSDISIDNLKGRLNKISRNGRGKH